MVDRYLLGGTVAPTLSGLTAIGKVNSIAALKALSPTTLVDKITVEVLSYYSAATPDGGGTFEWDSTTSATDNGGTIIAPDAGGTGRWRLIHNGIVSVKQFGMKLDGSAADTTYFQAALTAAAASFVLTVPRGTSYAKLTGRVTAPANTHIILLDGAELRWTATTADGSTLLGTATRPGIEVSGDNFRIEGVGTLRGPSTATYVANEIGIFAKGTSRAAPKTGFTIGGDIELRDWGYAGWTCQFVENIDASGFYAHDIAHAGFFLFSCAHFDVHNFHVKDITPGDGSGQAYGYALTHDSTGYDVDPALSTPRLVVNPFCIDGRVHDFAIENVPTWTGADAHGGYEVEFYNFTTYNCRHGAALAGSSGDAANYAGENNKVYNGHCTTKKRDGSATTVSATDRNGLVVSGGATVKHDNIQVHNVTLDGYGDTVVSSRNVEHRNTTNCTISDVTILNWKGSGVYSTDSIAKLSGIIFGPAASATNATCIHNDFGTAASTVDVTNCSLRLNGGTAPAEGLRVTSGNSRAVIAGNDFAEATAPYAGSTTSLTKGISDQVPTLSVSGTPTAIDLATAGLILSPRVRVTLDVSGNSTIADITGATIGQIIELYAPTTNATTFDRSNAALDGSADWVSGQYDTLTLECVNTSGVKFVERGRATNG